MSEPPVKRVVRPLYSLDGIVIGTLLGSLVAGIYMMMHNYVALNAVQHAKRTVSIGMSLYAIIVFAFWAAPATLWGGLVFALLQTGIAYLVASRLQGASISYYAKRGVAIHGLLRSAIVGVLAGVLAFTLALGMFALIMV